MDKEVPPVRTKNRSVPLYLAIGTILRARVQPELGDFSLTTLGAVPLPSPVNRFTSLADMYS